jgi:hypothetical protein
VYKRQGDADLTITLKQQASLGILSLEDLNSHPLKKTLSQKQLVSIHEQLLRYSQGKVTERQNNVNAESKSFKEQLIIGIQTDKVLFNGKQYSLREGERIAFNPITNRMEGLSALNSFAVDSLVNEYIRRADNVILDEKNATASDVRRELAKLKNEMMTDAGILDRQAQGDVQEGVDKTNPFKVPTTKDLFDGIVSEEEEGSDLSVIVNKAPVAKNYNPTIHLPPNKQLTMGQVLQKDLKDKNTAIQDAVLGSPQGDDASLKLGKATGGVTTEGRKEFENNKGGTSTEYSIGVRNKKINNGELTHIPSIYNGKIVDQKKAEDIIIANDGKDPETGRLIAPGGDPEARSKEIKVLSIPEQRKAAFDKAAPDVPNERSSLRNLQDDAKFQSDRTIMDVISDLVSPKKAEGASTSQDADFDPDAPGPRGFDKDNQSIEGTRNELAKELGLPPDLSEDKFKGGTSEESDIEGFEGNNVDAPVYQTVEQVEKVAPNFLSGLTKKTQEDIKRQLEGRGVVNPKTPFKGDISAALNRASDRDMFSKEHPKVRDDLKREVIDQLETFTPILKRTNSPLMKVLEILTEIEDGGDSASKTKFVHRPKDKAGVFTAMFGVTTKAANDVLGTTFRRGDSITTEQAIKVVEETRQKNLKDIEKVLKNSTIKLTPEQKIVMTLLTHNTGLFSVKFPSATKAFKVNNLNQAKIEMFSKAKGPNKVEDPPGTWTFIPGLFKKNNMLLGLFERFDK